MRTTQLAQQLRPARVGGIRTSAFNGRRNLTLWNPPKFENEKMVRSSMAFNPPKSFSNDGHSSTTLKAHPSEKY